MKLSRVVRLLNQVPCPTWGFSFCVSSVDMDVLFPNKRLHILDLCLLTETLQSWNFLEPFWLSVMGKG